MRGERRSAFAFTEPSGPDAGRPTWARRDGDELLIEGRKAFVTGGSGVDFYAVMVNVEEDGAGPGGGAMVIVERGAPGLTLRDDFVSLDGATHCQLTFHEVRVPQSNVVGTVGEGMPRALGNVWRWRRGRRARRCGSWSTRASTSASRTAPASRPDASGAGGAGDGHGDVGRGVHARAHGGWRRARRHCGSTSRAGCWSSTRGECMGDTANGRQEGLDVPTGDRLRPDGRRDGPLRRPQRPLPQRAPRRVRRRHRSTRARSPRWRSASPVATPAP